MGWGWLGISINQMCSRRLHAASHRPSSSCLAMRREDCAKKKRERPRYLCTEPRLVWWPVPSKYAYLSFHATRADLEIEIGGGTTHAQSIDWLTGAV